MLHCRRKFYSRPNVARFLGYDDTADETADATSQATPPDVTAPPHIATDPPNHCPTAPPPVPAVVIIDNEVSTDDEDPFTVVLARKATRNFQVNALRLMSPPAAAAPLTGPLAPNAEEPPRKRPCRERPLAESTEAPTVALRRVAGHPPTDGDSRISNRERLQKELSLMMQNTRDAEKAAAPGAHDAADAEHPRARDGPS